MRKRVREIEFDVDAYTARLIGRENVSKLEGAVLEIVKNAYDADACVCCLYYSNTEDCVYIVDNGCGMKEEVLRTHWMTIGNSSKKNFYVTKNGRIQTGAKGIGRFALERMSDKCDMLTISEEGGLEWIGGASRKLMAELAQIEAHVERALFYARADNPEQDCLLRQVNLGKIAAQAIENHRSLLIWSGVRVEMDGLDCAVYTDEKWTVFILGQLLQNAARYRGTEPVITLSAKPLGNQIRLTIQDNGIGIPAHELPRVFERGFTGSNGRNRGGSTGMGLYLCGKLSGFLELGLDIASEEGKWTTVTLTFPAKENLTKL